jgi:hypothetical protein
MNHIPETQKEHYCCICFEVLTAVKNVPTLFWVVTPYGAVYMYNVLVEFSASIVRPARPHDVTI